jgi:alkyl hydroperoxide reductase subunit AhpC
MMDTFTDFSMVKFVKFVHVKSEKFIGRFTILIFMDDKLSEMEIEEWKDFSNHIKDFKHAGASVVGVCTDSHISLRTMMMGSLQGVSFPIISDRDGDFSRAYGVLKVKNGKFGAARALVILDREGRMVHMTLHNENTRSFPGKVVELIKKLQGEAGNVIETRVGDLGSKPTISDDSGSGSQVKNSSNVKTKDISSISMSVFKSYQR